MKRLKTLIATTGLLLSSFSWLAAVPARAVTSDETCEYSGSGAGFQDDASWINCTELSSGDSILLPASAVSGGSKSIANTNPNFVIKNIIFSGAFTTNSYTLTGEAIDLTGSITGGSASGAATHTIENRINLTSGSAQNITINTLSLILNQLNLGTNGLGSVTGSGTLAISGVVSGSGALNSSISNLILSAANTYTGATNITAGTLRITHKDALGTAAGGTTIADGAMLKIATGITTSDVTIAEPLTLNGAGLSSSKLKVEVADGNNDSKKVIDGPYYVLSGALALGADVEVSNTAGLESDLKLTGALTGTGKKITPTKERDFVLWVAGSSNATGTANAKYRSEPSNTNLADGQNLTAGAFQSLTAPEGVTAGNVTINQYGFLKGKGSVVNVTVDGGTVAPGLSPGCLTATGAVVFTGGTFAVELDGKTVCNQYDQLIIDTTGSIDLGTDPDQASLSISRNNFTPAVGDKFTIINNKSDAEVTNTFKGLDEGATTKVNGVTYKITYVGGDGNDVVLEVTAVDNAAPSTTTPTDATPGTPNTGITPAKIFANLLIVSFIGVAISWVLVNRNKRTSVKAKR